MVTPVTSWNIAIAISWTIMIFVLKDMNSPNMGSVWLWWGLIYPFALNENSKSSSQWFLLHIVLSDEQLTGPASGGVALEKVSNESRCINRKKNGTIQLHLICFLCLSFCSEWTIEIKVKKLIIESSEYISSHMSLHVYVRTRVEFKWN